MQIYIHRGEETEGPYTLETVRQALAQGSVQLTDFASYDGGGERVPLPILVPSLARGARAPQTASLPPQRAPNVQIRIYILRNGMQLGPYTAEEVNVQLRAGVFTPSDVAKYDGSASLWPLMAVPGVEPVPPPSDTPIPTPATASSARASADFEQRSASPPLHNEYAGFWARALAYVIDTLVMWLPCWLISSPFGFLIRGLAGEAQNPGNDPSETIILLGLMLGVNSISIIVITVPYWLYFALMESSKWQGSLGKRLCGLQVVNQRGSRITFGNASGRYFAKCISVLTLGIGFVMAAFTERKQALHDKLAGTYVVDKLSRVIPFPTSASPLRPAAKSPESAAGMIAYSLIVVGSIAGILLIANTSSPKGIATVASPPAISPAPSPSVTPHSSDYFSSSTPAASNPVSALNASVTPAPTPSPQNSSGAEDRPSPAAAVTFSQPPPAVRLDQQALDLSAANDDRDHADAELNTVYQGLLSNLEPVQQNRLREQQMAWFAWRDAEVERLAPLNAPPGTNSRVRQLHAINELTQNRIQALRAVRRAPNFEPSGAAVVRQGTPVVEPYNTALPSSGIADNGVRQLAAEPRQARPVSPPQPTPVRISRVYTIPDLKKLVGTRPVGAGLRGDFVLVRKEGNQVLLQSRAELRNYGFTMSTGGGDEPIFRGNTFVTVTCSRDIEGLTGNQLVTITAERALRIISVSKNSQGQIDVEATY